MNKINYKQPSVCVPTREEFDAYAKGRGWDDWSNELWAEMEKTHWLKNNGESPKDWKAMVNSRNAIVMKRFGKTKSDIKKGAREKTIINEIDEEFPDNGLHYVAYTDGSCDNLSKERAGGSAYVILKDGEIAKMKNHGQLNTSNNRMELLAIISAVNACPDGAFIDIYTDSQYCILVLSKSYKPKKNPDLYELYKKCVAHVGGVRFHWVKGHDGNTYNELADQLAYGAYCDICDQYNIEKTKKH
jgi:ribonuclease HI|nr:MAG TPA: ribonuclease HI [Caudoviricetes sp.]